ncbi:hypothetical protein LJC40_06530 [Synergistaceae bacterium OttesenSCG-928-D05]|nr:hypothetical protein [Synergistaceae bacterium OttesenSCG-928-D05]
MGPSRRRKHRFLKIFLVLIALAGGLGVAAESRYAVMRIADISVRPRGDILSSETVWGLVSEREEAFWPYLWAAKKSYEKALEEYYPVKVRMKLVGWGKFELETTYLQPLYRLFWDNKYWYVSQDGKVWLATLDMNKWLNLDEVMRKPVLTWGEVRTTPVDMASEDGNVYVSSLPIARIRGWYENIELLGWSGYVKFIQAGKREGISVVRLIFKDAQGGNGADVLFPDDPVLWQEPGLAIKKIYPDAAKLPPEIFIDTTYKGKILVRNKVQ